MTYLERNALGFEGDTIALDRITRLVVEHQIQTVIETGTFHGASTQRFANIVNEVITIEVKKENLDMAIKRLSPYENVHFFHGSSDVVLAELLPKRQWRNVLFFLDAHWDEFNPLLKELEAIANNKLKPVIIIHDFKVPDHPELGFDVYGEIVYEWDYIKGHIENIYGQDGFTIEYNSRADGAKRGFIYIHPIV